MRDKNIIKWRIMSDNEDQMHHLEPPTSCNWQDSFHTLKTFLDNLTGNTHVVVILYSRDYKPNAGGALANMVFKHYYKLNPYKTDTTTPQPEQMQFGSINQLLALNQQIADLKTQMAVEAVKRENEQLANNLKMLQKSKPSEFESVAKIIGREFAREMKRKRGQPIADDVEDEDVSSTQPPAPESDKSTKERTQAQRAGAAIADIAGIAGQEETVDALEKIAKMAKTNPHQLAQILQALQSVE